MCISIVFARLPMTLYLADTVTDTVTVHWQADSVNDKGGGDRVCRMTTLLTWLYSVDILRLDGDRFHLKEKIIKSPTYLPY